MDIPFPLPAIIGRIVIGIPMDRMVTMTRIIIMVITMIIFTVTRGTGIAGKIGRIITGITTGIGTTIGTVMRTGKIIGTIGMKIGMMDIGLTGTRGIRIMFQLLNILTSIQSLEHRLLMMDMVILM